MNKIHSTAVIGEKVKMGKGNVIGENVVIDGNIFIGDDNKIGPGTIIQNNVKIGDSNEFVAYVSVGSLGEMGTKGDLFVEDGFVEIGSKNKVREFVTINSPVRNKKTVISDNCYLMSKSHVPHDAELGDNVTMATSSIIGGGTVVQNYAYIGLGSITHQWRAIGESSMIGMQAANTKDIPPFVTVVGAPSKILKVNRVGAERRGFENKTIKEAEDNLSDILNGKYSNSGNPIIDIINSFTKDRQGYLKL